MRKTKTYWVVDVSRDMRFGPYTNKKLAAKDRTIVRVISDMFLEIGSNVGVVEQTSQVVDEHSFLNLPIGKIADVLKENEGLRERMGDKAY